ncbi:MAG: DUF6036 family nucleotidyltransferase [Kiritimatiellia bacterium]|nr:DUF6036 family nucleotidyltransferase [Kiritimatiellia bacterium]
MGGMAVQRWGEPRLTQDVDVTLLTGFGREETFIDFLLSLYPGRRNDAKIFALKHRVLLLRSPNGIGVDIALAALPFEETCIERATYFEFLPVISLLTCSAEDLIVMKAFAEREIDWHDVKGIIIRQQEQLDWDYIHAQLTPLCDLKESPSILMRLKQLRKDYNS